MERLKVLVIDDSDSIISVLRVLLPRHGIDIAASCRDLEQVHTWIATAEKVDVCLLDYSLTSFGDGLEFFPMMDVFEQEIPTIIVTGSAPDQVRAPADPRVVGVIYKPFPIQDLVDLIHATKARMVV